MNLLVAADNSWPEVHYSILCPQSWHHLTLFLRLDFFVGLYLEGGELRSCYREVLK